MIDKNKLLDNVEVINGQAASAEDIAKLREHIEKFGFWAVVKNIYISEKSTRINTKANF